MVLILIHCGDQLNTRSLLETHSLVFMTGRLLPERAELRNLTDVIYYKIVVEKVLLY